MKLFCKMRIKGPPINQMAQKFLKGIDNLKALARIKMIDKREAV